VSGKRKNKFAEFARLVSAREASLENALTAGFFTFAFFKYKVILMLIQTEKEVPL